MRPRLSARHSILLLTGVLAQIAMLCLVSAQSTLQVGYSIYTADSGTRLPVGTALFRVSDSAGVAVSEAGVGAAEPIRAGRIFVDEVGTRMGLALVNANSSAASITFVLLNSSGTEISRRSRTLGANQHLAAYVSELFPEEATDLRGSLSFDSSQPLAAITLRENRNSRNEPLYTTLPVTDLSSPRLTDAVVFPHIAAGGGFTTELLLMNPSASAISGNVFLYESGGQPAFVQSGNQSLSQIPYSIAANGTFRTALTAPSLVSGWATAVPSAGSTAPSGSVIFQWMANDRVISEAGVAATAATRSARIFVDYAQTQTGVAIVNPSDLSSSLTLTLMDRNGNTQDTQVRTLPAANHMAAYVHELFPGVTEGFTGLLEIRSSAAVVPIALKLTVNARSDLVLTTLPVADLTRVSSATRLIFPHIAIGGAFATRLIMINTDTATAATGRLSLYQSDSNNMVVPMGGETGSQFLSRILAGGGRQFLPGNTARVSAITVIDPVEGRPTTEITVNEGSTVPPRFQITDSTGAGRDDFDVAIQSMDTTIATLDSAGKIRGEQAGFSTLIVSSGGVVTTTTATVVRVDSGVPGLGIQGVVRDLSNRLYLAASSEHAILQAEDLRQTPLTYAGTRKTPGLANGPRLNSQFRNPAFLAVDQAQGTLYVSDGANNVIRRVTPGTAGIVETVAGTGSAGSLDGPLFQATFNNPQGIALDSRGNLWIADSGNHVVRRMSLQTGAVETVAGMPGVPGFVDGRGRDARFRGLVGIAIQNETIAQQLERERRGDPAPPVRVLVADTGNNVIRRITEDGLVETIGAANVSTLRYGAKFDSPLSDPVTPIVLNGPTSVAADPFGNIFVTETKAGRVKALLNTGNVVPAAGRTFSAPTGIAIKDGGKLVVADSNLTAQEVIYGPPVIFRMNPIITGIAAGTVMTIQGQNFAPDSVVTIGRFTITDMTIKDSGTITLRAPTLPGGRLPVVVRHRGGLAQTSLAVVPPGLNDISAGYITTIAGADNSGGDGALATLGTIASPYAVAMDQSGNLFVAERVLNRIRRIDATTQVITTVAGTLQQGFSGEGGPATAADVGFPNGLAIDRDGSLLVTTGLRIRKVDAVSKIINTIAGNGMLGSEGDGGPARLASLTIPIGITADSNGNVYVNDGSSRIRKINGSTSIITTVAGNGVEGYSGDNGPATQASIDLTDLQVPKGLAVDPLGNLFFVEPGNRVVRRVDFRTGVITTVAGNRTTTGLLGDGGPATSARLIFPIAVALDPAGNLLIGDTSRIRKINASNGIINTVAGTGVAGYSGDNGPAVRATMRSPQGIAVDGSGNFFFTDTQNHRIRRVDSKTGTITTTAGTGEPIRSPNGDLANVANLLTPVAIAMDRNNGLLIAERDNAKVRRVDLRTGIITTIAGIGIIAFSGDNGPATAAELNQPGGVVTDTLGNVFVLERQNRLRMISAETGTITTIAGNGSAGYAGDGGPANRAMFDLESSFGWSDRQIDTDSDGNIYIPDTGNHRVRWIERRTGIIRTIAGNGQAGFSGDNGPATAASLNEPVGVEVDDAGNLFIADSVNNRIRKVDARTGLITTVAGTGTFAFGEDGVLATATSVILPIAVTLDAAQNLYISERGGGRIRRVNASTGIITTVAGGPPGFAGDGNPARSALFTGLSGIRFDAAGNLYIADLNNHRIRAIRGPIP